MDDLNQGSGIQSIDYTEKILELFCHEKASLSLKEIAESLDDSPAKIFRYLVSLIRIGLINKTPTNEYEIGTLALDLSFKALNLLDPVEEVSKTAKELNHESSYGIAVSIWGSLGPTVIRSFEPIESVYSKIRIGSVMSLMNSSIGNTFAKYLPEHILFQALDIDQLRHSGIKLNSRDKKQFITKIKKQKSELITLMVDRPSPGLSSISMPVFSLSGEIQFVITAFHQSQIILDNKNNFQELMIRKMEDLSKRLGLK
ncbi:IclR family transcriptional regulator domain-containing protein [Acinetobacter indicus]|uniref:IclR family transcriptional regulator domain-containing protein n=1 Tax=Acinetobacter indicus TaxID=756892 RepID=UPI000CEB960C|nr:helix-turn-helix domain-containing protein [Acinetobacter indicus]